MPATFPAHPAAVLPLKLWRPRWFDGVALTIGSMAPDLAYALDGSWLERPVPGLPATWQVAHSLPWHPFWVVPVAFVFCPLIRWSAPTVAPLLPRPLRGYASIGPGPRWFVTAASAIIGGASHVLWDRLADGPLDLPSSILGGVLGLWLILHFGRHLPTPTPQTPSARPFSFWAVASAVFAAGLAVLPFLPGFVLAHTSSARLILLAIAAVLAATLVRRLRPV
ncbi:MAG TPA: DUF4184 family protein [Candidatus Limnocylindrales bacterium]